MERKLTRGEVEAELKARSSSIERRLDSLEYEAQSFGQSVLRFIYERPFLSVGGAIAAGILLGLLFGGRRGGSEAFDVAKAHAGLIARYSTAMAEDIRRTIEEEGVTLEEATRRVLSDNAPLIVHENGQDKEDSASKGILYTIVNTMIGIAVRLGTEALLMRMVPAVDKQVDGQEGASSS